MPLAFGYGVVAAAGAVLAIMVPVFLAWTVDAQSTASWNDALGVTIAIWALAHRAHVHAGATNVVLSPLLMTLGCVYAAKLGARAALPEQRVRPRDLRLIFLVYVLGYLVAAQVLVLIGSLGSNRINPFSLVLGPLVVASLGVAWAAWDGRDTSPELHSLDMSVRDAAPLLLARSIHSARRGLFWYFLAGLAVVVVDLAWHGGRVWSVHQALAPGLIGGILLVVAQIVILPNIVFIALGWSAGAPMHLGAVTLGHSGMTTGTLPMVPALGAVPDGGVGGWTWIFLVVPLVVGALIGLDASRNLSKLSSLRAKVIVAACASGLATVTMWVIWWFSSASVSTGLLGYVGPGWQAWLLLPLEFVLPAVVAAGVRHWVVTHRPS